MLARVRFLCALAVILLAGSASAGKYNDANTPEGWAWEQIRKDHIADLTDRTPPGSSTPCGPLDPQKSDRDDRCHLISAQFVVDALTDPKLQAQGRLLEHRRQRRCLLDQLRSRRPSVPAQGMQCRLRSIPNGGLRFPTRQSRTAVRMTPLGSMRPTRYDRRRPFTALQQTYLDSS